ncbi:MAG: ABC-2 family transporter protein [Verrucomicrobiota bacterium]|nr:ABC-2 family transporter protein [Verrucomicrobiota bacterium]
MKRYFKIYKILLRNSIIREMNFAANFWLWLICEALWFFAQIALIEVIFLHTKEVAGWNKWQVVMLFGAHHMTSQFFQAFFFMNLTNLPELIRTGKLDFILLQPMNAQFAVSVQKFGFDNLINGFVGLVFVAYACMKLGFVPSLLQIVLFFAGILLAMCIHYGMMMLLSSISFWIIKAQGLVYGYYTLMNIARYPDAVFGVAPRLMQFAMSIIIPVMVVSNVPVRLFNDITTGPNLSLSILFFIGGCVWMMGASALFWRFALRHYTSASS